MKETWHIHGFSNALTLYASEFYVYVTYVLSVSHQGTPVRLEIGPRDVSSNQVMGIRRDTFEKKPIPLSELTTRVPELLDTIQREMFERAKKTYDEHVKIVLKWDDFVPMLDAKNFVLIPWCETGQCEDQIKENSARK